MTSRYRILGRYLALNGVIRPRLALALRSPTAIEIASDQGACQRHLLAEIEEIAGQADLVMLDARLPAAMGNSIAIAAMDKGLGVAVSVDTATKSERLEDLRNLARAGLRGILVFLCGHAVQAADCERQVEERYAKLAEELGWPLAVLAAGPLARGGAALRALARSSELCGLSLNSQELTGSGSLPDLSVIARLLAARVEDRPAVLQLPAPKGAARVCSLALACGYGLILADKSLGARLAPFFAELPEQMSDPLIEDCAVFIIDEREGGRIGEDAVQSALLLLARGTGQDARFLFQDRPDLPAAKLVWVAAHGPLSQVSWTQLHCLVRGGAQVIITALTLDDDVQKRRLAALGIEASSVPREQRAQGFKDRPLLDCNGFARFQDCGAGAYVFVERPLEHEPASAKALAFVREVAERAGLPLLPTKSAMKSHRETSHTRMLDFVDGRLVANASEASLRWLRK